MFPEFYNNRLIVNNLAELMKTSSEFNPDTCRAACSRMDASYSVDFNDLKQGSLCEKNLALVAACLVCALCKRPNLSNMTGQREDGEARKFFGVQEFEMDPALAGVVFFCRRYYSAAIAHCNASHEALSGETKETLVQKLRSMTQQFSRSRSVIRPTVAIENMNDSIRMAFEHIILVDLASLYNLKTFVEALLNEDVPVATNVNFFDALKSGWQLGEEKQPALDFVSMFRYIAKVHSKNDSLLPRGTEQLNEILGDVDGAIKDLKAKIAGFYQDFVRPFLMDFDYFLQCSWLVSVLGAVLVHPPPDVFTQFLGIMTYTHEDATICEDDEKVEKMLEQIGAEKVRTLNEATELLARFRVDLLKKCNELLGYASIPEKDGEDEISLVDDLNRGQDLWDTDEGRMTTHVSEQYAFPPEFSTMSEWSRSRIIRLVASLANEDEAEENEEEEEEGAEEEET